MNLFGVFLRCRGIITVKRPFYFDSHKNADKHGKEKIFGVREELSVLVNVQTGGTTESDQLLLQITPGNASSRTKMT